MKEIFAVLLLLALAALTCAQDGRKSGARPHPNLTGTWVLDRSKSGGGSKFDSTLVITHHDPELRITRTDIRKKEQIIKEYVFYTDGRGESNPMYYGDGKFYSDTTWEGANLVAYDCGRKHSGHKCRGGNSQKWQLSADGQKLTHTTSYVMGLVYAGGGIGAPISESGRTKLVYRRAQ